MRTDLRDCEAWLVYAGLVCTESVMISTRTLVDHLNILMLAN